MPIKETTTHFPIKETTTHLPFKETITHFADTSGWYVEEHGTLLHDMLEKYQVTSQKGIPTRTNQKQDRLETVTSERRHMSNANQSEARQVWNGDDVRVMSDVRRHQSKAYQRHFGKVTEEQNDVIRHRFNPDQSKSGQKNFIVFHWSKLSRRTLNPKAKRSAKTFTL